MQANVTIQIEGEPRLACVPDRYASNGRPAVLLYEAGSGELWNDLTVNLDGYAVPDDATCAFVPADRRRYVDALARRGLVEVIGECAYGRFASRATMVRLAEPLLAPVEV